MKTIELNLPENVVAQLQAEEIDEQALDTFLIAAVEAWLKRRQMSRRAQTGWDNAFQSSAIDFVDQLIADNPELFAELAQL